MAPQLSAATTSKFLSKQLPARVPSRLRTHRVACWWRRTRRQWSRMSAATVERTISKHHQNRENPASLTDPLWYVPFR